MKTKVALLALLALAAPLLLAVACGGDGEGDEEPTIRTQKGLAVSHYTSGQPAEESFIATVTITFAVQ